MSLTLREALLAFRRAPSLSVLSIVTIGFALFVVSLFALVAINLRATLDQVGERVEVVLYLQRGTPIEVAMAAYEDIEGFPEVASVTYVTEDEALNRARAELDEFQGLLGDLETNPLPASLELRLHREYRDEASVTSVAERLRGYRFAEDIRYGRDWIAHLDRLRDLAGLVAVVIGCAFAIASIIIIATTVRMTVMHRERELGIMKMVGATDAFIRLPFVIEGALKGTLGGLLSVGLTWLVYRSVRDTLQFGAAFFTGDQILVVVVTGTLLGLLASSFSVGRHLARI